MSLTRSHHSDVWQTPGDCRKFEHCPFLSGYLVVASRYNVAIARGYHYVQQYLEFR